MPRNLVEVVGADRVQSGLPFSTQRLDESGFGRRQQLRQHGEVAAAGGTEAECRAHVHADDVPARRKPQRPGKIGLS